jgi:eukaryotic-like serine/threonine-protein kinase
MPAGLLADRYQLGEVIGRGGMAEVHRAMDLKLGRPVAVKMLLDGSGDETDRARFIAEARTLAMLSHSGLVTVLDAGFGTSTDPDVPGGSGDRAFLVMELVDGPTLGQLMSNGPLPLDVIGGIAAQVAEALAYVHGRGVVHRDVKPGNVLMGTDDLVKLADFGIARLVERRTRHTASGIAIGTAAYVAPEQVNGDEVGSPADVYALGLVILEAVTGRREYDGPPAEAALARLARPPVIPSLPSGWPRLLTAMTALDPDDRPHADEVSVAIRGMLTEQAPVASVNVPNAATSPILAGSGAEVSPLDVPTQPMSTSGGAGARRTAAASRAGAAVVAQARQVADRVGRLSPEVRGVIAAAAALVAFLAVTAVVSSDDEAPAIPDNTPADLRAPLVDLHEAIEGDDETVAALSDRLDAVDSAIEDRDYADVRRELDQLTATTAQALVADDVSDEQADQIFDAARDLLAELPAARR